MKQNQIELNLRQWMEKALSNHMYTNAIYWSKKLVFISNSFQDIYDLAHIYYITKEYSRAEKLLNTPNMISFHLKSRLLLAQCSLELQKYNFIVDLLADIDSYRSKDEDSKGIHSVLYYVLGQAYSQMHKTLNAKEAFLSSIKLDVKCLQSLDWLLDNDALTAQEWKQFLSSIDSNEFLDFVVKMKLKHESIPSKEILIAKYGLQNDSDVLMDSAKDLFLQAKYKECLKITQKIQNMDPLHNDSLLLHISCYYETRRKSELFLLAHQLVDSDPQKAISWFAVGTFCLLSGKNHEARRYFSKASTLDPLMGAAWIGFGHSFAMESEHDQAISAYSAASRVLYSHVPFLFIGMQHLQAGALDLALEFLNLSMEKCDSDPLLLQELGVLHYHLQDFEKALELFLKAIAIASNHSCHLWESIHYNLGHTYRQLEDYKKAQKCFHMTLSMNPSHAGSFAALGMIQQSLGKHHDAILSFHDALSHDSENAIYVEMLDSVLLYLADEPFILSAEIPPSFGISSSKYFSPDQPEPSSSRKSTALQVQQSSSVSRGGMLTRSKLKNLSSDPFVVDHDSPVDHAKAKHFISSINLQQEDHSLILNSSSLESPFVFSGNEGGAGNLFNSPKYQSNSRFLSNSSFIQSSSVVGDEDEDEDVDMEVDDD